MLGVREERDERMLKVFACGLVLLGVSGVARAGLLDFLGSGDQKIESVNALPAEVKNEAKPAETLNKYLSSGSSESFSEALSTGKLGSVSVKSNQDDFSELAQVGRTEYGFLVFFCRQKLLSTSYSFSDSMYLQVASDQDQSISLTHRACTIQIYRNGNWYVHSAVDKGLMLLLGYDNSNFEGSRRFRRLGGEAIYSGFLTGRLDVNGNLYGAYEVPPGSIQDGQPTFDQLFSDQAHVIWLRGDIQPVQIGLRRN
jgi:hypothetical protein